MALTGGIATGKSHVRAAFENLGVPTIDADLLARAAIAPATPGFDAVVRRFGSTVVTPGGAIDRSRLAAIVFADPTARQDLEAIVHPIVRNQIDTWFAGLDRARHAFAVADIPLLFETGREQVFDAVIVAAADPAVQIQRVIARDGMNEAAARQRLSAQLSIDSKIERADYVIRTDGTTEDTDRQVAATFEALQERFG